MAIIGTSGAGKSSLGRTLATRLDVPYVELDGMFHQPNWSQLPPPEFERRVAEVAAEPSWVLDGTLPCGIASAPAGNNSDDVG